MEQGSNDWYLARRGKFTASEIHKLLGVKGLGETGKTYIFEKAVEACMGVDELDEGFISNDIKRGNELEPLAFEKFKELKELDFIKVEKSTFFPFGEHAGASPDGLVGDNAVLEIKAPRHNKFFGLVTFGEDYIDKAYVAQMQMQMLCTNSEQAHFFNYIIFNGQPKWHEIIVKRDDTAIKLIEARISEAIEIKMQYIELLQKNKQWE